MDARDAHGIDLAVVGASAGGVESLIALVGALPRDFAAAMLVVLHVPPTGTSVLPQILTRAGPLTAQHATDGAPLTGGSIYVAPPDCHLLVEDGRMRTVRGPHENRHRPAIDPLFRSAANVYGSAVAAVVLSGSQDDGTAGLAVCKEKGAYTFVQDPEEALYPAMPMNALGAVDPDGVLGAREIGRRLGALAALSAPARPEGGSNGNGDAAAGTFTGTRIDQWPGNRAPFTCPDCGGTLWEVDEGGLVNYRCRVGHAYSETALMNGQAASVETALWTALRALEERIALNRRVAERLRSQGMATAGSFEGVAEDAEAHAALLRDVLGTLSAIDQTDGPAVEEAQIDPR